MTHTSFPALDASKLRRGCLVAGRPNAGFGFRPRGFRFGEA